MGIRNPKVGWGYKHFHSHLHQSWSRACGFHQHLPWRVLDATQNLSWWHQKTYQINWATAVLAWEGQTPESEPEVSTDEGLPSCNKFNIQTTFHIIHACYIELQLLIIWPKWRWSYHTCMLWVLYFHNQIWVGSWLTVLSSCCWANSTRVCPESGRVTARIINQTSQTATYYKLAH